MPNTQQTGFLRDATGALVVAGSFAGGAITAATVVGQDAASVGVASTAVLAANPSRLGVSLYNDSANNIYLGLGGPAVNGKGIKLVAGASWDGKLADAVWVGTITAIAAAAASSLSYVEVAA